MLFERTKDLSISAFHHLAPNRGAHVGRQCHGLVALWELEDLIEAGCDLSEALAVISERRDFRMRHAGRSGTEMRVLLRSDIAAA